MTKVLVLGGPTAVGKTALAIQWAREFDGEIINADSRQIYREMDIGTAKPSPEEQAAAPHHLIDIVAPDEPFTLANFQGRAEAVIAQITSRGKLPILAGGTGMYITATLEGWRIPEVPPDPALRAMLEARTNEALLSQLRDLDPQTAARIDAQNPRRLVRALEVCLITGRPFSELRQKEPPGYNILPFALSMPREELYQRADARVESMLENGWIDEVRMLIEKEYEGPSMSALGYPQIGAFLRGELSQDDMLTAIKNATHRFIRRQYTWLRGHDPGWRWITAGEDQRAVIEGWLNRS
jgi:tRNA dimethylallyltransferase